MTVCICTYRRPELLERLLGRLALQQTGGLFDVSVAVVDNDVAESGRLVAEAMRHSSPFAVSYGVEPVQNIAMARNRVVAQATGDLLAFIDDDEFPHDDWLRLLFEEQQRTRVDGVLGPVLPHFDQPPPRWLVAGRFYDRETHPTGTLLTWTSTRTGNALLDAELFRGSPEPFSTVLGHGGEDRDFFKRQIAAGKRFTWCNEAIVYEVVPPHRWSRSFLLRRALHRGQGYRTNPAYSRLTVPTSIVAIAVYAAVLPFCALAGQHLFMKYLIKLTDHVGKCLAFVGFTAIKEKYVTQ